MGHHYHGHVAMSRWMPFDTRRWGVSVFPDDRGQGGRRIFDSHDQTETYPSSFIYMTIPWLVRGCYGAAWTPGPDSRFVAASPSHGGMFDGAEERKTSARGGEGRGEV